MLTIFSTTCGRCHRDHTNVFDHVRRRYTKVIEDCRAPHSHARKHAHVATTDPPLFPFTRVPLAFPCPGDRSVPFFFCHLFFVIIVVKQNSVIVYFRVFVFRAERSGSVRRSLRRPRADAQGPRRALFEACGVQRPGQRNLLLRSPRRRRGVARARGGGAMGGVGGQKEGGGTCSEWGGTSASDLLGVDRGDDARRLSERERKRDKYLVVFTTWLSFDKILY